MAQITDDKPNYIGKSLGGKFGIWERTYTNK